MSFPEKSFMFEVPYFETNKILVLLLWTWHWDGESYCTKQTLKNYIYKIFGAKSFPPYTLFFFLIYVTSSPNELTLFKTFSWKLCCFSLWPDVPHQVPVHGGLGEGGCWAGGHAAAASSTAQAQVPNQGLASYQPSSIKQVLSSTPLKKNFFWLKTSVRPQVIQLS